MSTLALVLALSTPFSVSAAEPTPTQIREAADAFDRGREAYKSEDWVTAAEQFERADARAGSPTALEYAIRSREKASQLDRAATLAALVAKRYPDNVPLAKLAADAITRAQANLYELSVHCSEACDLALDEKVVPGAPDQERTLYLSAGKHSLRAGFGADRGGSETVDATAGDKGQVSFAAPALPASAAELPPDDAPKAPATSPHERGSNHGSGWSPLVFWVSAGATAAVGAVTIWSGIDTLNNPGKDRIRTGCEPGDTNCPVYQEGLAHQRRTNALIGVSAGMGAVTALIGLFATDWGGRRSSADQPKSPEPEKDDGEAGTFSDRRSPRAAPREATRQAAAQLRVAPFVTFGGGALIGAEGRF